jgi:hypothetical protein
MKQKVKITITPEAAKELGVEDLVSIRKVILRKRIGMLRQWLNEDRIKDVDRFVTNEEIEHWLFNT